MGRIVVCALAALLLAGEAGAQVDLANATLDELMRISVTTATRTEESVASAPARIEVITAEQIQRRGYRSLTDVLKDLVDFKVDLAGDPDYPASVTIQGSRGSNLLIVLLDGVRISSPTNEPMPILANYPVHSAQQIEIVYGPASAVYGADAFAGVINIITKKGSSGLAVDTSVGQFGLFNQTMSYGKRLSTGAQFLFGAQYQYDKQPDMTRYYPDDFGDLQGQRTGTFNSIFGPMNASGSVRPEFESPIYASSMQAQLTAGPLRASFFASSQRASTSSPYTPDNGIYNAEAFQKNTLIVGSLAYTRSFGRAVSTSTLTLSRHELDPESGYWNVFSGFTRSYKYAYGSMIKVDEQVTWRYTPRLTFTSGATWERFLSIPQTADLNAPVTSHSLLPGTLLGTNIPDELIKLRYENGGAFAQLQHKLTSQVALTLGARADYNTRYGATFNPRAGVVLTPAPATTLKVLYGTAFLAPSPYESYLHYGSFYSVDGGATYQSDYWHLGNPDLKPQKKKTVEVTLLQGLGPSLALSASSFYSNVTDLRVPTDPDQAYSGPYLGWPVAYIDFPVNEGHANTYGATVGLETTHWFGRSTRLHSRVAVSAVDGRVWHNDLTSSVPIGAMVPFQLRGSMDLDWGAWSLAPRIAVLAKQRSLGLEARGDGFVRPTIDGYTTVDVAVRRVLSKQWTAFATFENAFDARYRQVNLRAYTNPEELVGVPQNPRRLSAGISIRLP
jgi:outer membrane receptor for ferrienterochelin and colicin